MNNYTSDFFPHSIRHYFATYDNYDKIIKLNEGFNPYNSYELNYRIYCMWGFPKFSPNPENDNAFFGTLDVSKKAKEDRAEYFIKRKIQGALNRKNDAKPESITEYHITSANDMFCTILPDCSMGYKYRTERKYYNSELPEIYINEQNIVVDENNSVFAEKNNNKVELGKATNKLFTNFTLMDAIQKVAVSDNKKSFNLELDMLENMEALKTDQNIKYLESTILKIGNNDIILNGYYQIGRGILPTYYWITENGLLMAINQGITYTILA